MYFINSSFRMLIMLSALCVILVACSTRQLPSQQTEPAPTSIPTPIPHTPTPPILTYDYVALGDSTPAGFDVDKSYVDFYAEYAENDLGAPVVVHNWARDGQTAHSLLYAVRSNADLRSDISEAEIITIWTGWNDLREVIGTFRTGKCGGTDNLDCINEKVERLNNDIDAILDEILALRSSNETLILIANVGNHLVADWKAVDIFDDLREPLVEAWIQHVNSIAAEKGIILVDAYTVFNGPMGDKPVSDELTIGGVHFNEQGHQLLADLHRTAGYGPLKP